MDPLDVTITNPQPLEVTFGGTQGPAGGQGPIGNPGPAGPNFLGPLTGTSFNGIIAGNGTGLYEIDPDSLAPTWDNILDRPLTFTPSAHTHGKADLPSSVAYEDEANTFTQNQTINGTITASNDVLVQAVSGWVGYARIRATTNFSPSILLGAAGSQIEIISNGSAGTTDYRSTGPHRFYDQWGTAFQAIQAGSLRASGTSTTIAIGSTRSELGLANATNPRLILEETNRMYFVDATGGDLRMIVNGGDHLKIRQSGIVCVGTGNNGFGSSAALHVLGGVVAGGTTVTNGMPVFDGTTTWNHASTVQNGIRLQVTDTLSPASSSLLQLQVNGADRFRVQKDGAVTATSLSLSTSVQNARLVFNSGGIDLEIGFPLSRYQFFGNVFVPNSANMQIGSQGFDRPWAEMFSTKYVGRNYTDASQNLWEGKNAAGTVTSSITGAGAITASGFTTGSGTFVSTLTGNGLTARGVSINNAGGNIRVWHSDFATFVQSGWALGWMGGSDPLSGSPDVRLQRVAAGSVGVYQANGTTLGTIYASRIDFTSGGVDTYIQHTATNQLSLGVNNGARLRLGTDGVRLMDTGGDFGWVDAGLNRPTAKTLQTRVFESSLSAWQETERSQASPSGALWSIFGATPIGRQTLPAAATDAATTQTLCNAIRTLLINFGFSN